MSSRIETVASKTQTGDEVDIVQLLLKKQMAPLRVAAAHRAGDLEALKAAVKNLKDLKMDDEVDDAEEVITTIEGRKEALVKVCGTRDLEEIVKAMNFIKRNDYIKTAQGELPANRPRLTPYLREEMRKAKELADNLSVIKATPLSILAMDKKTMTEIKSYAKPAPVVHRVMQAAFLLLNEDEEKTSSWPYCQKLCVPDGANGLNRKLMSFDASKLEPFIVQRTRELLKGIDLRTIQKASPGAATFYVWVMNVLQQRDDVPDTSENESTTARADKKVTPEDLKKQAKREQAKLTFAIIEERKIFSEKNAAERKDKPVPRQDYYTRLQ